MRFTYLTFFIGLASALHPVKDFRVEDLVPNKSINKKNIVKDSNLVDSLPSATNTVSTTDSLSSSVPTIELSNDIQMVYTDNTKSIYYITSQIIDQGTDYNETFQLLLDTGSSVTWVYNESCTSDACQQSTITKFNDFEKSLDISSQFGLSYSGDTVTGDLINGLANDIKLDFKSYQISNFTFGLASSVPDLFDGFNVSGILGIPSSNNKNVDRNLIYQLSSSGNIDQQIFGLSLVSSDQLIKYVDENSNLISLPSNYGGLMVLGSEAKNSQEKFITSGSKLYYTDLVSNSDDYWLIDLQDIQLSNDSVSNIPFNSTDNSRTTIIDTGTTGFVLPLSDADKIHEKLFGENLITDSKGNYAFPCDSTTQNITFTINDHDFQINVGDFKGKEYTTSGLEGKCASMIQGLESKYWVFGAAFLSKYYTVFDLEKGQIGFGDTRITSYVLEEPSTLSSSSANLESQYSNNSDATASTMISSSTTLSSSSISSNSTKSSHTSHSDSSGTVLNISGLGFLVYLLLCII